MKTTAELIASFRQMDEPDRNMTRLYYRRLRTRGIPTTNAKYLCSNAIRRSL